MDSMKIIVFLLAAVALGQAALSSRNSMVKFLIRSAL